MYGADTIKNLKKDLNGVPVVVAYHDLKGTPSSEEIANILKKEIDAGGDVAKIVVKPNSQAYVLRFLNGTLESGHCFCQWTGRKNHSFSRRPFWY